MEDFNDLFGQRPRRYRTGFYYAYEMVVSGLRHFCGNDAQWLPEYDRVTQWLKDNKGKGLLVSGDAGVGKSILCREIIPRIINSRGEHDICSVVTAYKLAETGETGFNRGVIMIDDIGVEDDYTRYGAHRNIVREVIDEAEIYGHTLIMTTNLPQDKLREKYGERTVDRLMSLCDYVVIGGENFRYGCDGSHGIPETYRAYGMQFDTQQEADAFRQEQDAIYCRIERGEQPTCINDIDEIREHQPLKEYNGVAYALFKYDWNKIESK